MSNNYFLEGDIQTGKSTLIRRALGDHISECGGFACQRLIDNSGNIIGFRFGPASSTPLNASVRFDDGYPYTLRYADGSIPDNIFKFRDRLGVSHVDADLFGTAGVELMRVRKGQRFMLLDEIGGIELVCRPFVSALFDLLESDVPCVGVIKSRINMEKIGDPEVALVYDELRDRILSGHNSRIVLHRPR